MVYAHNYVRQNHENTPDIAWDSELAAGAQAWAEHLGEIEDMEHSPMKTFGENISWRGRQNTADQAVYSWCVHFLRVCFIIVRTMCIVTNPITTKGNSY